MYSSNDIIMYVCMNVCASSGRHCIQHALSEEIPLVMVCHTYGYKVLPICLGMFTLLSMFFLPVLVARNHPFYYIEHV